MYNFILVHDNVIELLCYVMLLQHDIIYNNIITIRSFVINIFFFYFGGIKQAGKSQTTTPLNERRKCMVSTMVKNEIENRKRNFAKEKIFENVFFANSKAEHQKSKTKKLKNQDFSHTCVCAREKAKKG